MCELILFNSTGYPAAASMKQEQLRSFSEGLTTARLRCVALTVETAVVCRRQILPGIVFTLL
jgi:hypothetical protein